MTKSGYCTKVSGKLWGRFGCWLLIKNEEGLFWDHLCDTSRITCEICVERRRVKFVGSKFGGDKIVGIIEMIEGD